MIQFILNKTAVTTDLNPGMPLLDFIRVESSLKGTKIGCREGDCGACTVLEGKIINENLEYRSIVACLTPLGNIHGTHIVTVEGLNMDSLSPVQGTIAKMNATQCGFCTPGFIVSLTGFTMSREKPSPRKAVEAISGNICRCTGYKSIERASDHISALITDKNIDDPVGWLINEGFLPGYFGEIKSRLVSIEKRKVTASDNSIIVGGGTDLMVTKSQLIRESKLNLYPIYSGNKSIRVTEGECIIGAATTISEIRNSKELLKIMPEIVGYMDLVASEQIRNMGTIAGNIVNASPIGDLSVMLLALKATLNLRGKEHVRSVRLRSFFIDYKKTDLRQDEFIESVSFPTGNDPFLYNFEKVSKRTHLDIATVNSAIYVESSGARIIRCRISAGGVAPVPLFIGGVSEYVRGKEVSQKLITKIFELVDTEISPISDIRGTKEYKRVLLIQMIATHFLKLFPDHLDEKELIALLLKTHRIQNKKG